jgi:hypothetical protein
MSVDPIIARAQQALAASLAASLREAYYAGRGDAAMSLKDKVLALIDELTAPPPSHEAAAAPPPPHEIAAAAPHPAPTHEAASAPTGEAINPPLQHEIPPSTPVDLPEPHAVPGGHEAPFHAG